MACAAVSASDASPRSPEIETKDKLHFSLYHTLDCASAMSASIGRRTRERIDQVIAAVGTVGLVLRGVRRAPGLTASVVLILALGIGANTVMFGVVDRLLLSPPQHVVDADEVRLLHVRRRALNPQIGLASGITVFRAITYPDYQDFLGVDAFMDVALYSATTDRTVGRGGAANRARVVGASANLFHLLGVRPALGRFFTDQENPLAGNTTAVLSHEYWDRRHGRDPDVLGRTIDVGIVSLTVVGVAPAGFTGAELGPVDIWLPLSGLISNVNIFATNRDYYRFRAVARLAPGVTVEAAEAEATARHLGGRADEIAGSRYDPDAEVLVAPIIAARGPNPAGEARVARWLAGVSFAVLLIACFNVANLLLARSLRTRHEIAVRLALGAHRGRLIGELVTESLVLAAMGASVAVLAARMLSNTVHQILLPNVAFTDGSLGGRLFGFTLVVTLATGLLTGLIPAFHASKAELGDALRTGGHGVAGGRSRTRIGLIMGQVALSVVLLVGAGLFVQSLRSAQDLDLGFDSQKIVMVRLEFNESLETTERQAIYERALEGVRRLPGVHSAGLSRTQPFGGGVRIGVQVPGLEGPPPGPGGGPWANKVSSGYLEALGLTVLQGRGFEPADDAGPAQPVAVVTQSMAGAMWPDGDALGMCMSFEGYNAPCTEVVGIVENHHRMDLVEAPPPLPVLL